LAFFSSIAQIDVSGGSSARQRFVDHGANGLPPLLGREPAYRLDPILPQELAASPPGNTPASHTKHLSPLATQWPPPARCTVGIHPGDIAMATPITSFWHAIYKRLWAIGAQYDAHVRTEIASDGNFSLEQTGAPNGIFGTLAGYGAPLAAGDFTAAHNPLFVILNASLDGAMHPNNLVPVPPGNAMWPVMPWPDKPYPLWTGWNDAASPPRLIDRLQHWIEVDKKIDDTPKGTYLDFSFVGTAPPAFPLKPKENAHILFVASFPQDNGVRPGSVPAHYWDSSLIFVTDTAGKDQGLPVFGAGQEFYIAAVVGNSGNLYASSLGGVPPFTVICNAHVFSTFESPAVALPSLANLDAADGNTLYQPFFLYMQTRDVVGFRFNVDLVYAGLLNAMAGFTMPQLGGLSADAWLKKGHACVKVLIMSGELPSPYNNNGMAPPPTDKTTTNNVESVPNVDRHIGQRNLAAFDASVKAMKKLQWQDFMMSQAGKGTNALAVATTLPAGAVRTLVAVPTAMYERYVAKGGSHRGFEPVKDPQAVKDVASKPFPEAVILQQTVPGARLEIAEHAREPFFAMALGIELLKEVRPGDVLADIAMVHTAQDGRVVGGFTLRPATRR
jgi:hypothetical protein